MALAIYAALAVATAFVQQAVMRLHPVGQLWANRRAWDANNYITIASSGYTKALLAWMPGFALLARAMTTVTTDQRSAAVLASFVSGAAAAVAFSAWLSCRSITGRAHVVSLLVLLTYPYGFVLYGIPYSDGLFLAAALAAWTSAERDRLLLAVAFASIASATRPQGLILVLGLFVLGLERECVIQRARPWLTRKRIPARRVLVLAGLAGAAAFALYCWSAFGDPTAYIHAQRAITARGSLARPAVWLHLYLPAELVREGLLTGHAIATSIQVLLILGTICALPAVTRRFGLGYGVYLFGIVGFIVIGSVDFASSGRYLLQAFPVAALLGIRLSTWSPPARVAVIAATTVGLLAASALYFNGTAYSSW